MLVPSPALLLAACLAAYVLRSGVLLPYFKFFWHCFIRPIGRDGGQQKARLDKAGSYLRVDLSSPSTMSSFIKARRMCTIPLESASCVAAIPCSRCRPLILKSSAERRLTVGSYGLTSAAAQVFHALCLYHCPSHAPARP